MSAAEDVILDPTTHTYRRGLQTLASVSSVIRSVWPVKPSWDQVPPEIIENARDRGIQVDDLFSAWLNNTLTTIPSGTRTDARDRFLALCHWWQKSHPPEADAKAQVLLTDGVIAGTADIFDGYSNYIYDLKNTASIEDSFGLQLGAYAELYNAQHGMMPRGIGVIHVTQPKDRPVSVKVVEFNVAECVEDWQLLRRMWEMVVRRSPKRKET